MPDEHDKPEAVIPDSTFAASAVDIAAVHANVASLRADMAEVKIQLSALKAHTVALKADMAVEMSVMTDVVRLEQKFERLAAALTGTQEDVRKILQHMATKSDVERVLSALDAVPKGPR
jgi:chromosome condensin MukBEF ATPase and DNA-binding subunit MukB